MGLGDVNRMSVDWFIGLSRRFGSRCVGFALTISLMGLAGCGGGSGGGNRTPPPPLTPDFSLSLSPGSIAVGAGSSSSSSLSAIATGGFTGQIAVSVSGLPAGVTVTPTTITVTPGTPVSLTFAAAPTAISANSTVSFQGTSGTLSHTIQASLQLNGVSANTPPVRTRYVRTDATTEYFTWLNPHWMVFDPTLNLYFVADPGLGKLYYLDSSTLSVAGSIDVPGAFGISESPDHSIIYVGTEIGDVYSVDPKNKTVTHRWMAADIGPSGYAAISAQVLADGRVALLGSQGGIPSVDGSTSFAIWNPADNSFVLWGSPALPSNLCGPMMGNIGVFTLNAERTKVIIASIDSDDTICQIDATTGATVFTQTATGFLWHIAVSPDGSKLVIPAYGSQSLAVVFDAHTLEKLTQFPISGDSSSAASFFISPDSKTLYTSSSTIVYAYDLTSHNLIGWMPNVVVEPSSGGFNAGPSSGPIMEVADGTGLIAGAMEEGVGFLDTAKLQSGPVGTQFLNNYLTPSFGPVSGGTSVLWPGVTTSSVSSVFIGSKAATNFASGSGGVSVTAPSGSPGPADFYGFTKDGGMQLIPEGYSYGPTLLEASPNMSASDGGGTGYILGYGFGSTAYNATIPSDLRVTVGGAPATITQYFPNAYGNSSPPFPLEAVSFTIPAGTLPEDITISNSAGSATVKSAMSYVPTLQSFPLSGAALAQGIYDPGRDVYYFTDRTQVRVFSKTQGKWLTAIPITPPAGTSERLWGLALSPNGNKLAIADTGAGAIYVLDPDSPSSIQTFIVPNSLNFTTTLPTGVAISNDGIVYFTARTPGITGADGVFKLDTNSSTWKNYGINNAGLTADVYLRILLSNDGTRAFTNIDGQPYYIDTATGTMHFAPISSGCCYGDYELALSSDQASLAATGYFYDSDLNAASYETMNLRELLASPSYVYGAKLSSDGNLLFQPAQNGIDIFDTHTGLLYQRIAFATTLSGNYDALVSNGHDNVLLAITGNGNGIAVVDLSSIANPSFAQATTRLTATRDAMTLADTNRPQRKQSLRRPVDHLRPSVARPTRDSRMPKHSTNYGLLPFMPSTGAAKKSQ